MAEPQKIKTKKKRSALTVLIITLVVAFVFHSFFYSTSLSEESLTKSIEKYTEDNDVTLLETEREGNHFIALYTTEKPYYKGLVVFERGWNGLWAPVEYNKGTDICITLFVGPFVSDNRHVIGGVNCDSLIGSYEYTCYYSDVESYKYDETGKAIPVSSYGGNTSVYSNAVTKSNFIHIYNDEKKSSYSADLKIYDSAGNSIESELTEAMKTNGIEEESEMKITGTGDIKFFTLLIILIGFLTVWNSSKARRQK